MDFGQVLHTAQKNEKNSKNGVRYYSTKFEAPKKVKKSTPELSANIKKFLAKKEAEEKRKLEEDKKKRDELLALRSQDKKATRRVNVMLKRTKSANQSVIEDAVDNDNTAVTLAGPMQPDEDDYGYVSQEASAFYQQMMEKYNKLPDEPKFDMTKKKVSTNLTSTKDRVKAALEKEKEDALLPHRRKRKHKDKKEDEDEEGICYDAPDRGKIEEQAAMPPPPPPKPKPKPKMVPPPLNFAELLKIAEKKQHEPIIIEKKEKDNEPLFTKKQRREMERERESQRRREERRRDIEHSRGQKAGDKPSKPVATADSSKRPSETATEKIPQKPTGSKEKGQGPKTPGRPRQQKRSPSPEEVERPDRKYLPGDLRYKPEMDQKKFPSSNNGAPPPKVFKSNEAPSRKQQSSDQPPRKALSTSEQSRKLSSGDYQAKRYPSGPTDSKKISSSDSNIRKLQSGNPGARMVSTNDTAGRKFPPSDMQSKKSQGGSAPSRNGTSSGMSSQRYSPSNATLKKLPPKQFPPSDLRPKQFPPADVRRIGDSGGYRKKPMQVNKRRIIDDDDDDEYDSEMDDFIDDDDDPENDYSRQISEIFGYDKSRYRDVDDDIDNMESSFAQVMKEDVISTKIGIMEDLEDMKKEEEEKKRKMLMKKRRF